MGAGSAARISAFFDPATNSVSYLIADPASKAAAVIDPVLDFDAGGEPSRNAFGRCHPGCGGREGLTIAWVLETHPHADHLSAADYVRTRTGAKVGVGAGIREVQARFGPVFEADDLKADAGDFDRLFRGRRDGLPLEISKSRSWPRQDTLQPA